MSKYTILIIDDDEIVRFSLREMLEYNDIHTLTAADGIEALKIYSEVGVSIDLVFLDFHMPRLNGYDTFIKLKEINEVVQVLLITGDIENDAIKSMRDRGLEHVMEKPLKMELLEDFIENLKNKKQKQV